MKRSLVFLTIYLIAQVSFAQIYNSSVTAATAGSGRAAVDIGEASFLNPAALVHLRGSNILLSQSKSEFAASVSENNPQVIFPAALGYVQKILDGPRDPKMHDMRVTLADKIGNRWSVGVTGHYYEVKNDLQDYNETNADVGLMFTPTRNWGLAVVSYDVGVIKQEMPEAFRLTKTTGAGLIYLYHDRMRFRFDALSAPNNNFSLMTTMLGYEVYLSKWVVGRMGHQEDRFNEARYATFGIGLDLPRFDLNYAFVSELPRNSTERHSIDLAVSF
jgi:hypothetical protein